MLQLATRSLSFFLAKIIIHIKETEKYLPKPFVLLLTNSKWPITHTRTHTHTSLGTYPRYVCLILRVTFGVGSLTRPKPGNSSCPPSQSQLRFGIRAMLSNVIASILEPLSLNTYRCSWIHAIVTYICIYL